MVGFFLAVSELCSCYKWCGLEPCPCLCEAAV